MTLNNFFENSKKESKTKLVMVERASKATTKPRSGSSHRKKMNLDSDEEEEWIEDE